MCRRVDALDPAIDPDLWRAAGTDEPVDLAQHRDRLALCFDVALDGSHATLVGAATLDGVTHVEVIKVWQGFACTKALRAELPALVERIRPRTLAWLPNGPSASVAADLVKRRGWPPRRVVIEELKAEVPQICMGAADVIHAGQVRHPRDEMLTQHVKQTQKLKVGDRWVYTRRGSAPIDGAYAMSGAIHAARTLPPPPPPLTVL
jgi:hypothetical protein